MVSLIGGLPMGRIPGNYSHAFGWKLIGMRFYEKLVEILNVELLREKKQKQNNFQLIEFQQENWSHWQVITAAEGIEI